MKNKTVPLILAFVAAIACTAAVAGGAAWWWTQRDAKPAKPEAAAAAKKPEPPVDDKVYKYVSLEKVVVMLRGSASEPVSHYMAVDLVFKTPLEQEKAVKEHLPLLRSIAVRSLSSYTMDKAGMMTIDQFAADINRAFADSYKRERRPQPFAEAMIGKLIIE